MVGVPGGALTKRTGFRAAVSLVATASALWGASTANAQASYPATVTSVVDGDTLHARFSDGREVTVRLIGIDTPETVDPGAPVECGGPEASRAMEDLVQGRTVRLRSDPTQPAVDRFGRALFVRQPLGWSRRRA